MLLVLALLASPPAVARPCSAEEVAALTAPADATTSPFRLTCFAALPPGRAIQRRLVIEGAEASGAGIDCNGGSIGRAGVASTTGAPTVGIWSRRDDAGWSAPGGVRIARCTINGNVRIWGAGRDDVAALRASSRTANHTAASQAAAPSHITLEAVTFIATGSIPLYVGPGVTGTSVTGGSFRGRSVSTAVYLDAESADAMIRGVDFDIRTGREQIAVDGSARNQITGNRFRLNGRGGVFLYRNCGEDGVIRHQTPSNNRITDNRFEDAAPINPRAVVVGSREGRRRYCGDDAGYPFGSSLDDGDHAIDNFVARNTVRRRWSLF